MFTPPANNIGLFVYRVNAQSADAATDSRLGTIQYDNLIPRNPAFAEGQSITQAALAYLLSGILGSQSPAPGSALVVSAARDCQGREVRGGVLELIDGETGQPVPTGKATGQLRSSYFFGGIPTEGCTFTSADKAIWSAINAPVNMPGNAHKYSVRLSGRMHDTDVAAAVLGETPIETWTDQASIVRPYRLTPP